MDIHIVGDGVFGTFLRKELSPYVAFNESADIVILAVPASAYEEIAAQFSGKHLINVCSVQMDTTVKCCMHSNRVTSIHPMFGPRSPVEGRTAILTWACNESQSIIELFSNICKIVKELNGESIDPPLHDRIMAVTHLQVVLLSDKITEMVKQVDWIPDELLPTSFKRLKALSEQFLDMPAGTKESILANPMKSILSIEKGNRDG